MMKNSLIAALVATGAIVPATAAHAQQKPVIAAPRSVLPAGAANTSQPFRYQIPSQYNWLRNYRTLRVTPRIGTAWRSTSVPTRSTVPTRTSAPVNAQPVVMTPNRGPTGTPIQIRLNRNFGSFPTHVRFRANISRGVPAQILVRLGGASNTYTVSSPIQLCVQGGGRFNVDLIFANRPNISDIGTFTSTNC